MIKVIEHIENILSPRELTPLELVKLQALVEEFGEDETISGVNVGTRYLVQGKKKKILEPSIKEFFSKLGGILKNQNLPPITQKINHICYLAKDTFNYWDYFKGKSILDRYVNALEGKGWSEEQILADLEAEILPLTKSSGSWSSWRNQLDKWTADILNWPDPEKMDDEDHIDRLNEIATYKRCFNTTITIASRERYKLVETLYLLNKRFLDYSNDDVNYAVTESISEAFKYYKNHPPTKDASDIYFYPNALKRTFPPIDYMTEKLNDVLELLWGQFLESLYYKLQTAESFEMLDQFIEYWNDFDHNGLLIKDIAEYEKSDEDYHGS